MKKTYQNPEMTIVKVQIAQMIAASKLGFGADVTNASGAESRRGSNWDDDEDFE